VSGSGGVEVDGGVEVGAGVADENERRQRSCVMNSGDGGRELEEDEDEGKSEIA
jgi:hypothetical protein